MSCLRISQNQNTTKHITAKSILHQAGNTLIWMLWGENRGKWKSTYRGLCGLVVVRLSWLSGRALVAQARGVLGWLPATASLFLYFHLITCKFIYKHITGFVQYMYSLCRTCTCFARTHETTSCPNKSYFMLFSFTATTCQFWWLVWLCCFLDQFMQVKLLVQVPVLCCHSNYNLPAHRTSFHEIK